jgi:arylsulfatase A-like enzyme
VFDRCYAASFPTVPCRSDILTGKYNFTYLGWAPLPQDEITLPQVLTREGYVTAGIADTPFYMKNGYGYDRGFGDFYFVRGQGTGQAGEDMARLRRLERDHYAAKTMAAAEEWLELHYQDDFFLLVDTWDPHEPWDAPEYYVRRYLPDYDGRSAPWPPYWYWQEAGLMEDDVRRAHAHYCAEVTMVDRAVGRLLERLESLEIADETAIFFTADHGFYFGEHGIFGKGLFRSEHGFRIGPDFQHRGEYSFTFKNPETGELKIGIAEWQRSPLYEETTRVPLIVRLPGAAPRRSDALVSIPDLMPTVLGLFGAPIPDTVQAPSLTPLFDGTQDKIHDFVITSWPLHEPGFAIRVVDDVERTAAQVLPSSVTDGEWTLIASVKGEPIELYHLPSDPRQESNVASAHQDVVRELHAKTIAFLEKAGTSERLLGPRRRLL